MQKREQNSITDQKISKVLKKKKEKLNHVSQIQQSVINHEAEAQSKNYEVDIINKALSALEQKPNSGIFDQPLYLNRRSSGLNQYEEYAMQIKALADQD